MERVIGRLSCSQVIAMVFALGWATCPMAFAAERGKQEGKRITREIVSRAVGVEQTDSLMNQIKQMDIGIVTTSTTASTAFTLDRPDGRYVFTNMVGDDSGSISGNVAVFDPYGQHIANGVISRLAVIDENRIDFDISVTEADATAAVETLTSVGSIVGVAHGVQGVGLMFASANGDSTRPALLNYGKFDMSGREVSPLPLISSLVTQGTGGVADDGETCGGEAVANVAVAVACVVAAVIIIALVIMCYVFLFWTWCY